MLQRLCQERGEDFASLSRLIGRNPAYIQQFIRRGTPRRLPEQERRVLARHFGVAEELLGGPAAVSASGLVTIAPLEQGGPSIAFDEGWLAQMTGTEPNRLALWRVEADSMAPTLQPGEELLVDGGDGRDKLRDGLYLLRVGDRLMAKRLTLHPISNRVTVQSDNPAYADWPDLPFEEIDPVGRIIWTGRRLP